ncbi:hypothetical protein [Aliirhizobium cellulosilyticum]|uniref:Uncharacterized protein n=1 Tax=Aliirhizobium cellulosilyticum TaxID=393664 RepID=A0A7W6S8R1_9HYPH|nr:hypothetical protein [Rhizobium cellulosilyticum]MBB4349271.1 hypothetical protein [Rhizobium cellulosilyticum]MBB4412507.1 hypothetical protein [Rhizobium cellulosilyticum]MBB4447139.1 hypothetical protein [Rhizobium cellulosilyticum]
MTATEPKVVTSTPPRLSPTTLHTLIERGFSETFGIQLYLGSVFHEPEMYSFDNEDNRIWGATVMHPCRIQLSEGGQPTFCYASAWMNNALFRLVCVGEEKPPHVEQRQQFGGVMATTRCAAL